MMNRYIKILSLVFVLNFNFHTGILPQGIDHWETIVMSNDIWRYFLGNIEPPSSWASTGFDDSAWHSGKGGIGYGDNDDSTVISPVGSVYMRIRFNVTDINLISALILFVDFDDGFVAYINDQEIARENIGTPGTRPRHDEYAILTTYEARMPTGGLPASFFITREKLLSCLRQGENVLALQVHNCNATSSDLSSTAFLMAGINTSATFYRPVPSWFTGKYSEFTHLPLVVIDTRNQVITNEPKITVNLKVINNGPGNLNSWFMDGTDYDGMAAIELRGQSSMGFPKKSYGFELRGVTGSDTSASLLGMPKEEDWILHAHYTDKTMLRNALTFYLGSRMGGAWQPRFRYCSVYLNGQYQGVYLLMEKIKRGENRVDISRLLQNEVSDEEITGGYILKVDKIDVPSNEYFISYPAVTFANTRNYRFTYVYPKPDSLSMKQRNYIKGYLADFESVLNTNNFSNPKTGYRKYIDVQSFIDFQIMQELSNNVDGYRYSTYFYKKKITRGGLLYAGPLWDFDLCYGNVNYSEINLSTSGWLFRNYGPYEYQPMHWWARLMEDTGYAKSFLIRWKNLRKDSFSNENIMHFIDSIVTYLGNEIDKNYQRWPILGKYVWPNYFIGKTYEEEISFLKNWITNRLAWMDLATDVTSDYFNEVFDAEAIVYPNPLIDKMTVMFSIRSLLPVSFEIYDFTGKQYISELIYPAKAGVQQIEKEITGLKTGYYIILIKQNKKIISRKLVCKY